MRRVVDAQHADLAAGDVDLVQRARVLRQPPIGRDRLIEQLQQEGAVDTVMADEDDGFRRTRMASDYIPQRIGAARRQTCNDSPPGNRIRCGALYQRARSSGDDACISSRVRHCHSP